MMGTMSVSLADKRESERLRSRRNYAIYGKRPAQVAREARMHAERRAQLAALKMAMGCVDCAYRGNHLALQFDHVRGVKRRAISAILTGSLAVLIAELEKCEVRCANCHMIRTHS